ncbi:unnamed protein product [Dibothriocephalus latus]|uniref:Uncharacterized protein n=1 Tax=Dibothriocephalus latus TaxID=60516 RepID=A0A3P7NZ29_DIBLA|nr:unnamed protein product [Dibothriocephalus latus]
MRIIEDLQVPRDSNEVLIGVYLTSLTNKMRIAAEEARIHLQGSQRRQKDHYDRLAHGSPYEVGDIVWLRNYSVAQGMPS